MILGYLVAALVPFIHQALHMDRCKQIGWFISVWSGLGWIEAALLSEHTITIPLIPTLLSGYLDCFGYHPKSNYKLFW